MGHEKKEYSAEELLQFAYKHNQIPEILFAKDTECRYVYTSEIENVIDGGEENSIIGKTDMQIQQDPELGKTFFEQDREIMRTGKTLYCYCEFNDNGKKVYREIAKNPVYSNGELIGVCGVVSDVTELMSLKKIFESLTFFDTLTDYIRDQDNKKTIQGGTYGIFVIIMVINFQAVLYIHALTFVRRRHNFAILKAIGRTDNSIILPMLLTKIGQGIVVSIVAVFIVTLLCRLYLSEITKNIVLVDGWKSIALVLAFVLFIQIVAIFMDVIQLKRQRILKDLREE